MDLLVALAGAAVVGSFVSLIGRTVGRRRLDRWREAARVVALTDVRVSDGFMGPTSLTGRVGELPVTLETYRRGKHHRGTRITVRGLGHGPFGLRLEGEGFSSSLKKVLGERELEIGERTFDDAVFVQGQAPLARALLDAATRAETVALLAGRVPGGGDPDLIRSRVVDDALEVECRERPFDAVTALPQVLSAAVALARRLEAPPDVARRIADNLGAEPQPDVRLHSLLVLVREFPDHAATREALLAARSDPNDEIRLRAGVALGAEGQGVLRELAARETCEDGVAGRAIEALGEALDPPAAQAILATARHGDRLRTARACLAVLGRHGGEDAILALASVVSEGNAALAADAARALGATGSPRAEEPLLGALRSESDEVRTAAAEALVTCGSTRAVLPLRESAAGRARALRSAARQAIAAIQSRLAGAEPGQVTLAADAGGQLSLAGEREGGHLSLVDDEPSPSPRRSTPGREAE